MDSQMYFAAATTVFDPLPRKEIQGPPGIDNHSLYSKKVAVALNVDTKKTDGMSKAPGTPIADRQRQHAYGLASSDATPVLTSESARQPSGFPPLTPFSADGGVRQRTVSAPGMDHLMSEETSSSSVSPSTQGKGRKASPKPSKDPKKVNLYKTELCRSWEETGTCRYGAKCQFAHSQAELRSVERHPKYKTEYCRTFMETGECPYGKRCCFIHDEPVHEAMSPRPRSRTLSPSTLDRTPPLIASTQDAESNSWTRNQPKSAFPFMDQSFEAFKTPLSAAYFDGSSPFLFPVDHEAPAEHDDLPMDASPFLNESLFSEVLGGVDVTFEHRRTQSMNAPLHSPRPTQRKRGITFDPLNVILPQSDALQSAPVHLAVLNQFSEKIVSEPQSATVDGRRLPFFQSIH